MCGSVTAAIPRKQTCHCGDDASPAPAAQIVPRTTISQGSSDAPSPTKTTFKVQKSSRPQSSRKQSFDPANFERIDMNNVNVLPFEQRTQVVPLGMVLPEGYTVSAPPPQMYNYAPQYANMQPQYHPVSMQPPLGPHKIQTNGFTNGAHSRDVPYAVESPLVTPSTIHTNGNSSRGTNGSSCCAPKPSVNRADSGPKLVENGRSCCAPEQKSHSHNSSITSTNSEPQEPKAGSCCASVSSQPKEEPASINGTPIHMSPVSPHQILPQTAMPFNSILYQQFPPPSTVFSYPPTYGSYQNPLQMSAWRQGIRSNNDSQPQASVSMSPEAPSFNGTLITGNMDTVHTCTCGDTCQCIGCAAHPYNDATQDYVRSAWASMSLEQPHDLYTNGQPPTPSTNGNTPRQPNNVDQVSSPTVHTPSSTTSGHGEEQSLSASDFFFVNYPFSSDGCGGDTMSCPCGDDCECIGCTIHRQPDMPCGGEKESCYCGDSCECVGCSIHNGGTAI